MRDNLKPANSAGYIAIPPALEADDIERSDNINFKFFCDEIFGDC